MPIIRIISFIVLLVLGNACKGQHIISVLPRWMIGVHMNYTIPQEPVSRILDHNHVGIQAELQYRLQYNKPFLAGVYFSESTLSKYVLRYEQSTGSSNLRIRERANTIRFDGGFIASFYPEVNWLIQPYLQGYAGLAVFESSSVLKDRDEHETIDIISESTTVTPSYGLDIGFHIVPNLWYLRGDVRIGFIGNTSTSFLVLDKENADTTGFPIDYFLQHTVAGKWMKVSMGLTYLF